MLTSIVDNEFTVAESFQFCRKFDTYTPTNNTAMVSFDIQSLFTKFPEARR